MKKFLSGLLAGLLIAGLSVTAIAAQSQSITATLNSVNIEVRGERVAVIDESYTLANGTETAKTIVYNETTYVPIRYFGEIMGEEIGWNQETSSVTIGKAPVAPAEPASIPLDYSDWSDDENEAFEQFKGAWKITQNEYMDMFADTVKWCGVNVDTRQTDLYYAEFNGELPKMHGRIGDWAYCYSKSELRNMTERFASQLALELQQQGRNIMVGFSIQLDDVHRTLILSNAEVYEQTVKDIWGSSPVQAGVIE